MTKTKAPPFVKVKYSDHAQKDANHVRYIGTRPGVERVPVQDELAADAAHIEYAGTRPRSTGLFGPDLNHPPLLAQAMREVGNRETGSSWRIVFSLREDDARELGVTNLAAWQDLTRRAMVHFTRAIGIEQGHLRWVAAHHPEQGHPHVHVIAWLADAAPKRKGELSAMELRDVRRGVIQEIFGPLRARLAAERTMARNTMLDTVKENVQRAERILQRIEMEAQVAEPVGDNLPPRFVKQDLEEPAEKITFLAGIMPGKGQAKLAYMPAEVKNEVRRIADWILSRPQMVTAVAAHEKATRELTRLYTSNKDRGDEAWQKAYSDLRDRVAQVVLRSAAAYQLSVPRHPDRSLKLDLVRGTMRSAWRALEKERLRAEAKAHLASLQEAERVEERGRQERESQSNSRER